MDEGFAATQAYPASTQEASFPATQSYPEEKPAGDGQAPAEGEKPKPKRGKPKDELAPPKPKNAYQRVTGEARPRLKEAKPELATDLKAMGLALKEEWDKVPQETKDKMQKEYEAEMEIWKPKWAAYKLTQHYKEFFEIKQDWIDARQRKKLCKKAAKEAPKRPRSGYMIFAGEIRERVQKEVMEAGGGMGDIGKKISEEWGNVNDDKKAEYAAQSAKQKEVFDVEYAKYKDTEAFATFCIDKAKLEAKQMLKKLVRTKLAEAPKKAPSSYALFRSEVMPKVCEENKGLSCGELGKKLAAMWMEVGEEKKKALQQESEKLKVEYDKKLVEFKRNQIYTKFLIERQQVKAKENKLLNMRELPKRPKNAFAMYADIHKSEVEPGKGEGKGRSALKVKFDQAPESEKAELAQKENELKQKWIEDVKAFKDGPKFNTFKTLEKKIKLEFMNEAMKVVTLRFLSDAPQEPPKSPFAVFVGNKRKADAEADAPPKNKKEKIEEVSRLKAEWSQADLKTKYDCDVARKERMAAWKDECKEYMAKPGWQEYIAECKKLKIPVQSILKEKKKILRKLKNGMVIKPLPSKPESMPSAPPTAIKLFVREKGAEIKDRAELLEMWKKLDEEGRKPYTQEAEEKRAVYKKEMMEFLGAEEGKLYFRQLRNTSRANRIAKAKDAFLTDLPKKPVPALVTFMKANVKEVKKANPEAKGVDLRKLLMDKWESMDADQKEKITSEAKDKADEYLKNMEEFKKTENWIKFKRAVKVKAKAKAKSKGKGINIPKPKRPEGMPQKPLDAFKTFCRDNAGTGKNLVDLSKAFRELPAEELQKLNSETEERRKKYEEEAAEFDKSADGRKYAKAIVVFEKRRKLAIAKARFLKDEPKRPQSAYLIFVNEKRQEVTQQFPDLKGIGPVQAKLTEMWKELSEDDRKTWIEKETEAKEEYEKGMESYRNSPNYKKYQAIVGRLTKKPGESKKNKNKGVALPPPPENLPKKPATGFFLYLASQRSSGGSGNLAKMNEGWREMGAEGQKKFIEEAAQKLAQYEKDMKEFMKTADGKKYFRLKAAADKRNRMMQAKTKFLGSSDAPKEPKRPPSPYFLFIQEKRSSMPPGKVGDVAKQLTDLWGKLTPEEKKVYEEKTDALKEQYEKDMAEYKNSPYFKKYDKALKAITKKKVPKAKAKAAKGGKGAGRGAGGGKGRGRGAAAPGKDKPADSDSDSDIMGSDDDNSSSSDTDTD